MHFNGRCFHGTCGTLLQAIALSFLVSDWTGTQALAQSDNVSLRKNVNDDFNKSAAPERQSVSKTLFQPISASDFSTQPSHLFSINAIGELQGLIQFSDEGELRSNRQLPVLTIFLIRNGDVVHHSQTREQGKFTISDVTEGPYSLVATGQPGFMAYGVYVSRDPTLATTNQVQAAFVSPQIPGVKKFLIETLPAKVAIEILHDRTTMFQQAVHSAKSDSSAKLVGNQIRLIDEQLTGQVYTLESNSKILQGTMVNLVKNGRRIDTAEVDARGHYSFDDIKPGMYDLVVVGFEGLAAIRFQAIGQDSPMTQISYGQPAKLIATSLDICLTSNRIP